MNPQVRELLNWGRTQLKTSESPELDASLLLAHVLGTDRLSLYTTPTPPTEDETARYRQLVRQRSNGRPVAYLVGFRDFWRHRFKTDPRALIPRPETELLVAKALEWAGNLATSSPIRVLDLCTGTGCVGISLALEKPDWKVTLADISWEALELAQENAALLGAKVTLTHSDLFQDLHGTWDLITANPPYLSPEETRSCLALGWGEPEIALNGGTLGTELLERLIAEAPSHLVPGGILLWEASPHQHRTFAMILDRLGLRMLGPWPDLSGNYRVWGMHT